MRSGGTAVALALVLGACRSRTGGAADAGLLPAPSALTCEWLVTPDVRDDLPGFTMTEQRPCPTCGPLCVFHSAEQKDVTVSIAYDCRKRFEGEDLRGLLAPTLKAGGVEVPAMGLVAARREPVPGMLQVSAWDDDTPCGVVITWLGPNKERALNLTRSVLFATTPALLARPPSPLDGGTR